MLSRKKREYLYDEIYALADDVQTKIITPEEINKAMASGISLNELEAMHFAKLIDATKADIKSVFLDSPDVIAERFGVRISLLSSKNLAVKGTKRPIQKSPIKLISEHKAKSRYPVVSAASIIAKVTRDREIDKLARKLNINIGSGYPSDSETVDAIRANLSTSKLQPHIRVYWKTLEGIRQLKMSEFVR